MRRLEGVQRDQRLKFFLNGQELYAYQGESVAAALLAEGQTVLRYTPRHGEPRGLFCGMGVCFDCVMTIDGRPNQQACLTLVNEGMRIEIQHKDLK